MVGIYMITNVITGQSYIGQSRDIMERFEQHFYHRASEKAREVDKAMLEYDISNFLFSILELCNPSELDQKEEYYINLYQTNVNGYNISPGGQHNIGISNANVKLTEEDVYNIRESYKNREDPSEVYIRYCNKITISYFYNLWEGKSWKHIHYDVYSDENKDYYKLLAMIKPSQYNFSDEEIIHYRKRYINESISNIYDRFPFKCPFPTFKSMINGTSYKHLPIYDKRNKIWINE